ncbi:hypothetical protein Tco_0523611 [Tanacetum coccineum]
MPEPLFRCDPIWGCYSTQVQEVMWSHHCVIDHLESVKDCPAGGWLERLNVNHEEDSAFLEALNDLVEKLSAAVRMKEKDVSDMEY